MCPRKPTKTVDLVIFSQDPVCHLDKCVHICSPGTRHWCLSQYKHFKESDHFNLKNPRTGQGPEPTWWEVASQCFKSSCSALGRWSWHGFEWVQMGSESQGSIWSNVWACHLTKVFGAPIVWRRLAFAFCGACFCLHCFLVCIPSSWEGDTQSKALIPYPRCIEGVVRGISATIDDSFCEYNIILYPSMDDNFVNSLKNCPRWVWLDRESQDHIPCA